MKAIERAATARVLIDLIKADKVIDSREMELYGQLKGHLRIDREDERRAFSMTLAEAIDVLKEMEPVSQLEDLIGTFEAMTASDGFCAREEALLMLMLEFCLKSEDLECDVISNVIDEPWFDERQVLYVESRHEREINSAISTNLRAISRELRLCGLDFVYLPQVIQHYISTPRGLMTEVVTMLSPTLSETAVAGLLTKLRLFKTDTFCIEQLHHKLGFKEMADTPGALLMRINQSRVEDRIYTNFLRIELTPNVQEIVQRLADTFLGYNGNDRLIVSNKHDEKGRFVYKGFYRQVFELLLLRRSVTCHLELDFVNGNINFPEVDIKLKKLNRKERALYALFVFEARNGAIVNEEGRIVQNGGISFTPPTIATQRKKFDARIALLKRRYERIYEAFGGDPEKTPDIMKDSIRNPMISRISNVIREHKDRVYDAESFAIERDEFGAYRIGVNPDLLLVRDSVLGEAGVASASALFASLAAMILL